MVYLLLIPDVSRLLLLPWMNCRVQIGDPTVVVFLYLLFSSISFCPLLKLKLDFLLSLIYMLHSPPSSTTSQRFSVPHDQCPHFINVNFEAFYNSVHFFSDLFKLIPVLCYYCIHHEKNAHMNVWIKYFAINFDISPVWFCNFTFCTLFVSLPLCVVFAFLF